MKSSPVYIGTAGWNIPRVQREHFPVAGSQLERFSARLTGAEINTSFYRPHAPETYARWAAAVPDGFRFSVKIPKQISHEQRLARARAPFARFMDESSGLGAKRGALLLQLPPKFEFDSRRVGRFFEIARTLYDGGIVCEPRHATWAAPAAESLLASFEVARVAADPPRAPGLSDPGGWPRLVYYRWHGSPRPYFSFYETAELARLAASIRASDVETWCIFDNTGSGAAAANALELAVHLGHEHPQDGSGMARGTDAGSVSRAPGARHGTRRDKPAK